MRRTILLLSWLLLCGCDALNVSKVDNPVFGPPPPRVGHAGEVPGRAALADNSASPEGDSEEGVRQTTFGIERSPDTILSGNDVIATVNGQPIFASEILDRYAMPLAAARKEVDQRKKQPAEFRKFQDQCIRQNLPSIVKTRLLSQALKSKLEKEQLEKLDEGVGKMYADKMEELKKQLNVNSQHELDMELQKQGTSLASVYNEFANNAMAQYYEQEQTKSKTPQVVGRPELYAYYQEHIDDFSVPTRVKWNLLQVSFAKHGGKSQAVDAFEKAIGELKRGVDFRTVAKKHSDGPRADQGGAYGWTDPTSISDEKTAAALGGLKPGAFSPVIVNSDHLRMVQVVDRQEAGRKPFLEVQESIRARIVGEQQKEAGKRVFDELVQRAEIHSPYVRNRMNPSPAEAAEKPKSATTR